MMARRMKLKKLYTDDLYRWKGQMARIGFDLVIDAARWSYDEDLK